MMKPIFLILATLTLSMIILGGCSKVKDKTTEETPTTYDYKTITAKEAKIMMDDTTDIIIIDVRTEEEYNTGFIENAILLPLDDISEKAEEILSDKTATILIYCRSGRRSALGAEELGNMGYSNVYNFGGILDWDYDIVTNP